MTTPTDTYVLFELAGGTYALPSSAVLHLEMIEHITSVPDTAAAVDGVVFSRGQLVPAINLRRRFGLPEAARTAQSRLVFIRTGPRTAALVVDAAREFRRIPSADIRAIEDTLVGVPAHYLSGVAVVSERSVLLVDLNAVLTLEETSLPAGAAAAATNSLP
jgi:purine-binding chemotaxis protein CheW